MHRTLLALAIVSTVACASRATPVTPGPVTERSGIRGVEAPAADTNEWLVGEWRGDVPCTEHHRDSLLPGHRVALQHMAVHQHFGHDSTWVLRRRSPEPTVVQGTWAWVGSNRIEIRFDGEVRGFFVRRGADGEALVTNDIDGGTTCFVRHSAL